MNMDKPPKNMEPQKDVSPFFNPQDEKGFKKLYPRVADEAKKLLSDMPNLDPEIKKRALELLGSPFVEEKVKKDWDEETIRGAVSSVPEKQERRWAEELVQKLLEVGKGKGIN